MLGEKRLESGLGAGVILFAKQAKGEVIALARGAGRQDRRRHGGNLWRRLRRLRRRRTGRNLAQCARALLIQHRAVIVAKGRRHRSTAVRGRGGTLRGLTLAGGGRGRLCVCAGRYLRGLQPLKAIIDVTDQPSNRLPN